ncbi:MAG TPA: amino acid adenylation domain-containing protein, partial [Ktedonobacterales bacterium]|nr:amino acid adenylation domain-containing protein [Ktedonobacterales bacterium]
MMDPTHAEDLPTSTYVAAYPLSIGQKALWSLYQTTPESVAYNLSGAVAVPSETNLDALRRAFQRLAERHPMLRTIFATSDGEPIQRVLPRADVDFRCEDASAWYPAQLDERLGEEIYRPFDIERHPAWRVLALTHAPIATPLASDEVTHESQPEHLLLLVFHHILGDLWSLAVMISELAALYREETTGAPATLKPLRARYADFVRHEAERLAGPEADTSWEYWRTQLAGDIPSLDLPADHPRIAVHTGRGAAESIALDQELTQRLRTLAETRHVAVYTILLTAFQILLHRYTGQDDVLVGFPKAGRSHAVARVVGYFVNTIVLRADLSEHPRFVELLDTNRRALDESAAHEWYPFAEVARRLRPARELGRAPIFQAMFSWQKTTALLPREQAGFMALGQGASTVDLGGLRMRPIPIAHRVAPVDLTMAAAESPDGLVVTLEYRTDLFDAATIARMAASYRILLNSIAADPDQLVSRLPILSGAERRQLVEVWNATAMPYPSDLRLHQFVERQAELAPEALAVVASDTRLTYRTLNQQANQLAHYLRQQGVGPDTPVALLCTRSAQALIGLVAILKAGGAYAPLDASYPDERLAFMLRDSAATLLLTERGLDDRLAHIRAASGDDALSGVRVFSLDGNDANTRLIRAQSRNNPPCVVTPDQLAYLIYTSGSTGQPNGVALTHRGVVSLLSDFQRRGPLTSGDACSWWTSLSFDVSVYEIFSAWLVGATVHVIPEHVRLAAPALLGWLQTHQIRSAYLPPFLLADYARWLDVHPGAAALRRLLVGVEPIPEHVLMSICAQLPDLCLLNGYGPTETTICSTLYQVVAPSPGLHATSDAASTHQRTPIGRPVANTRVYLLDGQQRPVPVGVVGELYIGGVGLARGYWRRPSLTTERFVPDPFSVRPGEHPSARLYRTGDLARMLPDGNLEYVGRHDSQVKLRGLRIELGEIEAALAQHPNIKQAAVLVRDDDGDDDDHHAVAPGDKRLVAYLTPIQNPPPLPDELRRFLAQRLPHGMLPSAFVAMDAFPLTPSGKVDWRALAPPLPHRSEQKNAYQAPRTDDERLLVTLWQEALDVERVGVNDNFFELGGDSILGIQIIARAADAGLHLTPRHIFEAPTVAGLAALAEVSAPMGTQPEQGALEGEVPLTPVQRWFFARDVPAPHHWNQSLLFLTRQSLDPAALRAAVAALLEHHDALRLRYTRTSAGWRQFYAGLSEEVPCDVIDLSSLSESGQTTAIAAQATALQRSLNLSAGPLIRVAYFALGATRPGRLLIVIHHLAIDGVSWRLLIEDLQIAYRQIQRGEPIRLPPKTTSYRDWAQRLADYAQTSEIRDEATFWLRAASADLPMVPVDLRAATGSLETRNTEGAAVRVSSRLNREETQALLHLAPLAHHAEVNDVLLTALARAFQRWTGSPTLW